MEFCPLEIVLGFALRLTLTSGTMGGLTMTVAVELAFFVPFVQMIV